MEKYDLTIIGGGPGGYAAALRAASLGLKTLLIEKEALGGTCLNRGCIPTKIYSHAALLSQQMNRCEEYGLEIKGTGFSMERLWRKKEEVVGNLKEGVQRMLKKAGVKIAWGSANTLSPHEIEIVENSNKRTVQTSRLLMATGAKETLPQIPGINQPGVLTSREALQLKELPSSMVVVGGGVIALEFASIFADLGVSVSIVHRSERFLRDMDMEMVRRLQILLRRKGISIWMNAPLQSLEENEEGLGIKFFSSREGEQLLSAEKVLISTGREACFGGQNLEHLGILHSEKGIYVNEKMETSQENIYAVGDATFPNYFQADVAYHQGLVAAENAAGLESVFHGNCVPSCVFTNPPLAKVGITEEEAKEKGLAINTGKFPFSANGKAACQGEEDGQVKIISSQDDGTVLGMHILGPHAYDLIQEGTLAVAQKVPVKELSELLHPHPTLSEAVWEAALSLTRHPLHFAR